MEGHIVKWKEMEGAGRRWKDVKQDGKRCSRSKGLELLRNN